MIKRCLPLLVALCILLSVLVIPVTAEDDLITGRGVAGENMPLQEMPKSAGRKDAPALRPEGVKYGIDVSYWQGEIDWDKVAPQIDFAIIRCGYGSDRETQDDGYWHANASACERLGIPYGVYLYSYATTEEQAISEARHVLRLLEGYSPTLPIYLDLEDMNTVATITDEEILHHATIFCDAIEEAGYTPGVYSFYNWWKNRLNAPEYDAWDRWVAAWSDSAPEYDRDYSVWQFSSTGTIDGIGGDIDENYWYGELPTAEPGEDEEDERCDGGEACSSRAFTDVPGHLNWAHEGIDYCVEKGLMQGISADIFNPYGVMTRAQLVTILYRVAGSPEVQVKGAFTDVPEGQWFSDAVEWAAAEGIVNGVGDGWFLPENEITREQLATILYRCSGETAEEGSLDAFPDREEVGVYARDAMLWATSTGLISGVPQGEKILLCPLRPATRAQAAGLIMRYLEAE